MNIYDIGPFFVVALKHELGKLGRGGQAHLAEKIKLKASTISDILNRTGGGSDIVRRKIADALGYELEEFVDIGRTLFDGDITIELPKTTLRTSRNKTDLQVLSLKAELSEVRKNLDENRKIIEEKDKLIINKDKTICIKDEFIIEKDKIIDSLRKELREIKQPCNPTAMEIPNAHNVTGM
jgi:transcriptional regulator with XRE-family HTH domain